MALDLAERAIADVHALHAFFVAWFGGDGSMDFSTCERTLAPDFRLINPDGSTDDRRSIIERLKAARGSVPSGFTIEVRQPCTIWQSPDAVLLEYVEHQYRDGKTTDRLSTALFTPEPAAPNGVVWRHLQETWIVPADEGPRNSNA